MTFDSSRINRMGRDNDFRDIMIDCTYVYVKHHGNGCFSEVKKTPALPQVKISSDHCASCFRWLRR